MKEIPGLISEFFSNMWNDFDYFSHWLANGGIMLVLLIGLMTTISFLYFTGKIR